LLTRLCASKNCVSAAAAAAAAATVVVSSAPLQTRGSFLKQHNLTP